MCRCVTKRPSCRQGTRSSCRILRDSRWRHGWRKLLLLPRQPRWRLVWGLLVDGCSKCHHTDPLRPNHTPAENTHPTHFSTAVSQLCSTAISVCTSFDNNPSVCNMMISVSQRGMLKVQKWRQGCAQQSRCTSSKALLVPPHSMSSFRKGLRAAGCKQIGSATCRVCVRPCCAVMDPDAEVSSCDPTVGEVCCWCEKARDHPQHSVTRWHVGVVFFFRAYAPFAPQCHSQNNMPHIPFPTHTCRSCHERR